MAESQTSEKTYRRQDFEIIVGVSLEDAPEEKVAVAEATRHLSAHSEEFRLNCTTWRIEMYGGDRDDWGVAVKCELLYETDDDLKRFMDEIVETPMVETTEKIY